MFKRQALTSQGLPASAAMNGSTPWVRRSITIGGIAAFVPYRGFPSVQVPSIAAWLVRLAVAAALAPGAPSLPARADGLHDPAQIEAHAQSAVAVQMLDMGVESVVFQGVHSVALPRADGVPGMAVCGTAEDMEGDPDGNAWAMDFIVFYERDGQGQAVLVGSPVFTRVGRPGSPTADGMCEAALATALGRSGQRAAGLHP